MLQCLIFDSMPFLGTSPMADRERIYLQWGARRYRYGSRIRKIPWSRKWQPTPVFLPGKSHGERNLVGYSPWIHKHLGLTACTHMTSLNLRGVKHLCIKQSQYLHGSHFLNLISKNWERNLIDSKQVIIFITQKITFRGKFKLNGCIYLKISPLELDTLNF